MPCEAEVALEAVGFGDLPLWYMTPCWLTGEGIDDVDGVALALNGDWRSKEFPEKDDEVAVNCCCCWLVERVFCVVVGWSRRISIW